jgi:hypothetical protein
MFNRAIGRQRRTAAAVAGGFAAVIAASMAVVYVAGLLPSPEEDCSSRCRAVGKRGVLVPVYSSIQTTKSPKECKCQ